MVETVLTAVNDSKLLPSMGKPATAAIVCTLMGTIGLLFVTRAGIHWLELFDTFVVNLTLFLVGSLECIGIGWVYGADRFAADVCQMTGYTPPKALLWVYKVVIPTCLLALTLESVRKSASNSYDFPAWGIGLGWLLAFTSSLPILVSALGAAYTRGRSVATRPVTAAPIKPPGKANATPEHTPSSLQIPGLSDIELNRVAA